MERVFKKTGRLLLAGVLALALAQSSAAFAQSAGQDGLNAALVTDKTEYAAGETVKVTLELENTNAYAVQNVSAAVTLPEGLTLKTGETARSIGTLEAGGKAAVELTAAVPAASEAAGAGSAGTAQGSQTAAKTDRSPDTGAGAGFAWAALAALAGAGLAVTGRRRPGRAKAALLLACLAGAGMAGLPGLRAGAAESGGSGFSVKETVNLAGRSADITADVSYGRTGTWALNVAGGSGSGLYPEGANITLTPGPAAEGRVFSHWRLTWTGGTAENSSNTVVMPASDMTAEAVYTAVTHTLTTAGEHVTFSPASLSAPYGEPHTVTCVTEEGWQLKTAVLSGAPTVSLLRPGDLFTAAFSYDFKADAVLTAVCVRVAYHVQVDNGTGTGDYAWGTTVTVQAAPALEGRPFDHWMTTGLTLADSGAAGVSFEMPQHPVALAAIYADAGPENAPANTPANTPAGAQENPPG